FIIKSTVTRKLEGVHHFHYYLCRQLKGGGMEINMEKQIKKCRKCLKLLPTNAKGEVMVKGDLCPDCLRELKMNTTIDWDERKREFENIIEDIRGKHTFDGLVMLSGGKDSVYVAYLLSKIYK